MTKHRDYGTVKETIGRLVEGAGGYKRVAQLLDRGKSVVYGYFDPDASQEISFASVVKITKFTGATQAAEMLAHEAGGVFMPGVPEHAAPDLARFANMIVNESGDVVTAIVNALSPDSALPGDLTPAEAAQTLKEVDELIHALVASRPGIARRAAPVTGEENHDALV